MVFRLNFQAPDAEQAYPDICRRSRPGISLPRNLSPSVYDRLDNASEPCLAPLAPRNHVIIVSVGRITASRAYPSVTTELRSHDGEHGCLVTFVGRPT